MTCHLSQLVKTIFDPPGGGFAIGGGEGAFKKLVEETRCFRHLMLARPIDKGDETLS